MRICRKGTEGTSSEAWNVPSGPGSPSPVLLPRFPELGGKHRWEEALAIWEGEVSQQQGKERGHLRGAMRGESGYPYASTSPTIPPFPGSPLFTCMISHRPSAPARVPVLGIVLHPEEKRKSVVPRINKKTGEWRVASEPLEQAMTQTVPTPHTLIPCRHRDFRGTREGEERVKLLRPEPWHVPPPPPRP